MGMTIYTFNGTVLHRVDRTGIGGLRVEAVDVRHEVGSLVGCDRTADDGTFSMSLTEEDVAFLFAGDRNPTVYFRILSFVYEEEELVRIDVLASTEGRIQWMIRGLPQEARFLVDPARAIGVERELAPFVIHGRVLRATTGPTALWAVEVDDMNLEGAEQRLGTGSTTNAGTFRVTYPASLVQEGKALPDVRIIVKEDATPIHETPIRCKTPPTAFFDIVVDGTEYVRPAFDVLRARLDAPLGEVDAADLTGEQIERLACSAGVTVPEVAAYAAAHKVGSQIEATSDLEVEALFGLMREGLPLDKRGLMRVQRDFIGAALDAARQSSTISAGASAGLAGLIDKLNIATRAEALTGALDAGTTCNLGDVLTLAGLEDLEEQEAYLDAHLAHPREVPLATFWSALAANPPFDDLVPEMQLVFQWGSLTRYHLPLMYKLKALKVAEEAETLRDLAKYNEDDWEAFLEEEDESPLDREEIGFPEDVPGGDPAEQRRNYAWTLTRTMELAFPAAAIGGKEFRANSNTHTPLSRFIENNPTFELGKTRASVFWASSPDLTGIGSGEHNALKARLLEVERLSRLTLKYEHIQALSAAGFKSARSIVRKGRAQFLADQGTALGDGEAALIFDKAVKLADAATFLKIRYGAGPNSPPIASIADQVTISASADPALATWSTLFGSLDHCACKHCLSVFGPGAYMVDLLQWLGQHNEAARDALFDAARRPDIQHIGLTCENTDTALPYIDLVNEILEHRIAAQQLPSPIETQSTTAELKATPEVLDTSVHAAAYATLAHATYPFRLPFHFWNEEARIYLHHLGAPRHLLMERLAHEGAPTALQIAQEQLGLSSHERAIITGTGAASEEAYWGMTSLTWSDDLLAVETLMNRAQLTFDDVVELVDTALLEAHAEAPELPHIEALENTDGCKLEHLVIAGLDEEELEAAWDDVQRFLRLRLRLGWSIRDLDRAKTALAAGLDTPFITHLADVTRLTSAFKVPLIEALSWWGPLDTRDSPSRPHTPSFYDTLFQNKALQNPVDPTLASDALTGTLALKVNAVLAGTRLSSSDYWLLTDESAAQQELALPVVLASDADLTVANLSLLYRHGSLARALKLSVADLRTLIALTGAAPLTLPAATATPAATRAFLERLDKLRASGLKPAEVHYLLRHVERPSAGVTANPELIATWLDELQAGHDAIQKQHEYVEDPTGKVLHDLLLDLIGTQLPPPDSADPEASREGANAVMAIVRRQIEEEEEPAEPPDPEEIELAELAVLDDHLLFLSVEDVAAIKLALVGQVGEEPEDDPPDPDEVASVAERIRIVQELLLAHRSKRASENLVVQIVSGKLGLTSAIADKLLRVWMTNPATPAEPLLHDLMPAGPPEGEQTEEEAAAAARAAAIIAITRLAKAAMVIKRVGLTLAELTYLDEHLADTHLTMDDLPSEAPATLGEAQTLYAKLERLFDFAAARKRLRAGLDALVLLLAAAEELNPTEPADLVPYFDLVAALTEWSRADLTALAAHFGYDDDETFAVTFASEAPFLRLADAFDLLRRLGASADEALTWLDVDAVVPTPPLSLPDTTLDAIAAVPTAAKRLAAAKHGAAAWPEIAQKLRDPFREHQRDALVAHQLHALPGYDVFPEIADLYGAILVDPEMAACQLSSRIKQATGSIQQFIQRIFLNLEEGFTLGPDAAKDWKWMRTYRIWEAARKVLLYPENWVLPELRDGKSPPFQQLESQLRQGELNDSTVEKAYRRFLDGLNEVARLDVISTFREAIHPGLSSGGAFVVSDRIAVNHVLARSLAQPYKSFYRVRNTHYEWSAWHPTDLEIPSDNCAVYAASAGGTFVAWLQLQEKPDEGQPIPEAGDPPVASTMLYGVTLLSSELRDGHWTQPTVALAEHEIATSPVASSDHSLLPRLGVRLLLEILPGNLDYVGAVRVVQSIPNSPLSQVTLGRYMTGQCGRGLEQAAPQSWADFKYPSLVVNPHQIVWGQEREPDAKDVPLTIKVPPQAWLSDGTEVELPTVNYDLLLKTPAPFDPAHPDSFTVVTQRSSRTTSPNLSIPTHNRPFFYRDRGHQFFVQVLHKPPPKKWTAPDASGPGSTILAVATHAPEIADSPYAMGIPTRKWANSFVQTSLSTPQVAFEWEYRFLFTPFDHKHVCGFLEALFHKGPSGLTEYPDINALQERSIDNFEGLYDPGILVAQPYPKDDVDFSWGGAYSLYNWELFFHAPFLIAKRLHADGRFEQAHEWLRAIFDPTSTASPPSPQRFWKVKPFREIAELAAAQEEALSPTATSSFETIVLASLLSPSSTWGNTDPDWIVALTEVGQTFDAQLEAWRKEPFNPHLVARMRPIGYMKATVMLYIENLLAWGDQLFRRDTIESINEATQLYMLAKQVLGRRPIRFDHPKHEGTVWTYDSLTLALDNEELLTENAVASQPTDEAELESSEAMASSAEQDQSVPLLPTLAFCLPPNGDLVRYWDTVDDRLFKIHHCMNIEGIVRELPLFEPPIDPALLVAAAAAGVDLSSVLNDIQGGLPKRRFKPLFARAVEIARDAQSFGASLLSNLEKTDGEHMARLSAAHESELLQSLVAQRKDEIAEARESVRALEAQRPTIQARQTYYDEHRKVKIKPDEEQVFGLGSKAMVKQDAADEHSSMAAVFAQIPDFVAGASGLSSPVVTAMLGGTLLSMYEQYQATKRAGEARRLLHEAQEVGQRAGYERRFEDWGLQLQLAQEELKQLDRQIIAAKVRIAIAEKALESHELQIEQSKSRLEFLKTKFTREELYADWLKDQLAVVFYEVYKLAYDAAKLAERAYRFERAEPSTSFITFGYWDGGKKGLLAGERLLVDLRKMDAAFEVGVRRDYELEKTVSLAELFPEALLELRRTGTAEIALDEKLFDRDHPGQFMRRLFSVGISIPTLAGPHASINCRLTLLKNKLRKETGGTYNEATPYDDRFLYDFIPLEAICTSTANGDIGMFAESAGEAEALPFQGAGAISMWRIELLPDNNAFDLYDAADVVLSVRYRAREGGQVQATAANAAAPSAERTVKRLVCLKEEYIHGWESFFDELVGGDHILELPFADTEFPFLRGDNERNVVRVHAEVRWGRGLTPPTNLRIELEHDSDAGFFVAEEALKEVLTEPEPPPTPPATPPPLTSPIDGQPWTLRITSETLGGLAAGFKEDGKLKPDVIDDIWLVIETTRAELGA